MYCPKCGKDIPDNSQFCLQCGGNLRPKHSVRVLAGVSAAAGVALLIVFALIVAIVFATYVCNESSKRDDDPSTPRRTLTQNNPVKQPERVSIVDKTFPVAAQHYFYYTIPLKADVSHITGHFTAQGGSNDIEVLVLDQDGFTNFSNSHSAQRYYASDGYVTTGSIDLRLRPGTYYIVFNNARAMLTNKVVTAKIDAEF
jgi:predicted nucleic acid-binding Zn ribbon protein